MGSWQILPSSSLYSPSSASVALLFVVLIALIWYHLSSTSMLFLLFPVALLKSLFNAFSSWRHSLIPRSRLFGVCSLRSPLWFPKSLFPYVKHNVGKCSIFLSTFLCYLTDHAGISWSKSLYTAPSSLFGHAILSILSNHSVRLSVPAILCWPSFTRQKFTITWIAKKVWVIFPLLWII